MWKYYYQNIEGVIFVLDASKAERLQEARDELLAMMQNEEAKDVPVLVFANKQDLPNALRRDGIVEHMGIGDLLKLMPHRLNI